MAFLFFFLMSPPYFISGKKTTQGLLSRKDCTRIAILKAILVDVVLAVVTGTDSLLVLILFMPNLGGKKNV